MNYGIYINFKLYSSTQQILKQHIILVKLLHNSTLVMKMFIQSGQYPNSNTVNYETKGWIHPQIMWDCSRADHYRSHFKEKRLHIGLSDCKTIHLVHYTTKTLVDIYSKAPFLPLCKSCIIHSQTKRQKYFQRLLLQSRLDFSIFPYACPVL